MSANDQIDLDEVAASIVRAFPTLDSFVRLHLNIVPRALAAHETRGLPLIAQKRWIWRKRVGVEPTRDV